MLDYINMNSTFVRKIMIDSRFRKTGVPGDFTFELNRAVTLPSKCAGFITDIELFHSWYTVDDHNEFLYFDEVYQDRDQELQGQLDLVELMNFFLMTFCIFNTRTCW